MSWNFETPGDLLYETTDNFYATKSMRSHVSHLAAREGELSCLGFPYLHHAVVKIFTHVRVVVPRVPATSTKLASFREVVHVAVS